MYLSGAKIGIISYIRSLRFVFRSLIRTFNLLRSFKLGFGSEMLK